MNIEDRELERRNASLLDVLIRAALILAMAVLCYQVFSPFLTLMMWALILAVTLYPAHQLLAAKMGGRPGGAATVLVLLGLALIVTPTAVLMSSLGDSVHDLINDVQANTLQIPPPRDSVAKWPIVGEQVHAVWTKAHSDLPGLVKSMQPKIGDLAKVALAFVAGIGMGLLQFIGSFIVAGIIIAFGQAGSRASEAIFTRIAGPHRGTEFIKLSTATIRAVAQGVIGVAFIQAIIVGICLLVAGVPWAGVLAMIVVVLGIAQVPALLVTLPAIAYIWSIGTYGTAEASIYTVLLVLAGMTDNVLKPLMLGRGVDAPMPVILIGALGGMAVSGILGMFVGATLLALGYQIFMGWVAENPAGREASDAAAAGSIEAAPLAADSERDAAVPAR
ncbi:MAG TPA: AI-2E family transporter [Usitatibacter sp.]|jgi:predicted PurR-regulated permease PerM|nr:AI-2E family transporter [Usitatibacter sp.]